MNVNAGTFWMHLKTGHLYVITGHCIIEATVTGAVLYRRAEEPEGLIWCRPIDEFMDGRFVSAEYPHEH